MKKTALTRAHLLTVAVLLLLVCLNSLSSCSSNIELAASQRPIRELDGEYILSFTGTPKVELANNALAAEISISIDGGPYAAVRKAIVERRKIKILLPTVLAGQTVDILLKAGAIQNIAKNTREGTKLPQVTVEKQFRGMVKTLAGSGWGYVEGIGNAAQFANPVGIVVDKKGDIYIGDRLNDRIRKIDPISAVVSTIAGSKQGNKDGIGTAAQFNHPYGLAIGREGNIYVADTYNHSIRKIDIATRMVSVLNVKTHESEFVDIPDSAGVAVDRVGNVFLVAPGSPVYKIDAETLERSVFAGSYNWGYADGIGTAAHFNSPYGIAMDREGNILVADTYNHRIRRIDIKTQEVTTIAGSEKGYADGIGAAAQFNAPVGLAVDNEGNIIVADSDNNRVRKIDGKTLEVTTIAGSTGGYADGIGTEARFSSPNDVAMDKDGNILVADVLNQRIRKIFYSADNKTYEASSEIAAFSKSHLIEDQPIRELDREYTIPFPGEIALASTEEALAAGIKTTINNGARATVSNARVEGWGVKIALPTVLYGQRIKIVMNAGLVADELGNLNKEIALEKTVVRQIKGAIKTLAGTGSGYADGLGTLAKFSRPVEVAIDQDGNVIVADTYLHLGRNNYIRKIDMATGTVSTIAGGKGITWAVNRATGAISMITKGGQRFGIEPVFNVSPPFAPLGIAVDKDGNIIVADAEGQIIRKIDAVTKEITILAGSLENAGKLDGTTMESLFLYPNNVAIDEDGNIYVREARNSRVRRIDAVTQEVNTLEKAKENELGLENGGIVVDRNGDIIITDTNGHRIQKIVVATQEKTTIAGNGHWGFVDGPSAHAQFNKPTGLAIDNEGNIIVADTGNDSIRKIDAKTYEVTTVVGIGRDRSYQSWKKGNNESELFAPTGVAVDNEGNIIVANSDNKRIQKTFR